MTGIGTIEPYSLAVAAEPPANIARWTVEPDRAVLLIHDMQRYFLAPIPHPLRGELVHHAALLRAHCTARGIPVAYTAQPGSMNVQQRGLLKDFWGPGMRATPADRQVTDELTPTAADMVFTKWRYSAFHRSRLLRWMRGLGRDQLLVCGVYAHIGVLMTAADAFTHDIETFVISDAVADFSLEHHRMALRYAAGCCAMVITTEEALA
ncbi:isochorismatase family protein [Streptomyces sp. NPDC005408]|uniref:isochorismatase family protein n=1 Tax=Streptomyces sp. NPDC005408 TaxID=3155341 RepID=UPI0033B6581E